jgi:hypothetical protein
MTGKYINELASKLDILNSIISWCDTKRLIINKDKSLALGFHHKLNKNIAFPDIILQDGKITYASQLKVLGAWINCNLNWDLHAENLLKS